MNWKEIKESCPKAFTLILRQGLDYSDIDQSLQYDPHVQFMNRELYDFFDGQFIYISIEHDEDSNVTLAPCWFFKIDTDFLFKSWHSGKEVDCIWSDYFKTGKNLKTNTNAKTRTEAEAAAFTKAFKILEERL